MTLVCGYRDGVAAVTWTTDETCASTMSTPIVLDDRSTSSTDGGRPTRDAVAHLGRARYRPAPAGRSRAADYGSACGAADDGAMTPGPAGLDPAPEASGLPIVAWRSAGRKATAYAGLRAEALAGLSRPLSALAGQASRPDLALRALGRPNTPSAPEGKRTGGNAPHRKARTALTIIATTADPGHGTNRTVPGAAPSSTCIPTA